MAGPDREKIRQEAARMNAAGGLYHTIEHDGVVVQGWFDMKRYLCHYGLPDDLTGRTVLDVGTASGYFAFECAKRGARVTAIDVYDGASIGKLIYGLGLVDRVRYVQKSVYDLDASFGVFDLVLCSALLLHLPDPFNAVYALRRSCRGEAIIATAVRDDTPETAATPLWEVLGRRSAAGDWWTFWAPNVAGVRRVAELAGFARTEEVSRFVLESEPAAPERTALTMGVVRALV